MIPTALLALAALVTGWALAGVVAAAASDRLADLGVDPATRHVVRSVASLAWLATWILVAFGLLGLPAWQSALTVAAALGVVAWVARDAVSLLIAGAVVRSADLLRPGAIVRIGELEGRVVEVGPFVARLAQADGRVALVPHTEAVRRGVVVLPEPPAVPEPTL